MKKGSFLPGVLFYQKQGFFGKGFLFQPSCEHVVDQSDLVPRNIYIWLMNMVNASKYTIHGSYGSY